MSSSKRSVDNLVEDWAFVNMQGAVEPKPKTAKKNAAAWKQEDDADLEVIKDCELTMSTITATTHLPPLYKETSESEEDWGVITVSDPDIQRPRIETKNESAQPKNDAELIQILSDSSSSCSFDVINESKKKVLLDGDNDHDDDGAINTTEFHFDFPTMVALFCLTTVLGFVIGHGVGTATSLLVMKTSILKIPNEVPLSVPANTLSEENIEQNENSQLEVKIQKWKSLYKNEKQPHAKSADVKNYGNQPGLKEAHKHLSLENYKVKKAYSDIQKQLALMKVMSWYRRAQVDRLRQNDHMNTRNVIEILEKELQSLEAVYFRQNKVASMWRKEDKENVENSPSTWKQFKERWSKKNKENTEEAVCMDKKDCRHKVEMTGRVGKPDDTGGSNTKETENRSGLSDMPTMESHEALRSAETEFTKPKLKQNKQPADAQDNANSRKSSIQFHNKKSVINKRKGDFGTVDFKMPSNANDIQYESRKLTDSTGRRNLRNEKNSLFWRLLRLTHTAEDVDVCRSSKKSVDGLANRQVELREEGLTNGSSDGQRNDQNADKSERNEKSSSGFLTQSDPDSFSYEVLDEDNEIVITYENKDSVPHILYGFFDGGFREIRSGPGDLFVISIPKECFNVHSSFTVSLSNDSPKPIQFFALLPNGKIRHQRMAGHTKVIIVQVGSEDGKESGNKPLTYEATIMENGILNVSEHNSNVKSGKEYSNPQGDPEKWQNEMESNEGKLNKDELSGEYQKKGIKTNYQIGGEKKLRDGNESSEQADSMETPQREQEEAFSDLTPGERHIYDPATEKIYRHTVSVHQYPISEYETLISQVYSKEEKVYYRFPQTMIIEKFIVKDEVLVTNDDDSISVNEDNARRMEDIVGNIEPAENILQQFLKNTWKDGKGTAVLMINDGGAGTISPSYITLSSVRPDDVISHDSLKDGKIEQIGENIKITSYLLYKNELFRIVREDKVERGLVTVDEEINIQSDSEHVDHCHSNSNNDPENSNNFVNKDMVKEVIEDWNSNNLTTEDTLNELRDDSKCILRLGESGTTEYWELDGAFVRETVERLMPTPKDKEEDFKKFSISKNNIDETVSCTYCEDVSVEKTWRRVEDVLKNMNTEQDENTENDVTHNKGLDKNWTDFGDHEYDDNEDIDEQDDTDEQDEIDDDIGDQNDRNYNNDDNIDEESDEEYDDLGEHDNYDAHDEDQQNIDYDSNDKTESVDAELNLESESANNEKSKNANANQWSHDLDSVYHNEKTNEDYEMFTARKWQNLKLQQQQFRQSNKQNFLIQQQMTEEWNKMKQQYREFQKQFQNSWKRDFEEVKGIWNDLKLQQKQYESVKKQIEEAFKRNLQEQWEKLKEKQAEIEITEPQSYKNDNSDVQHQEIIAYQRASREEQPETTPEKKTKHDHEIDGKIKIAYDEIVEHELASHLKKLSTQQQGPYDKVIKSPEQNQAIQGTQSDAWEMSDSYPVYTQDTYIENNAPHELPYVPKANKKASHHANEEIRKAWELTQRTSYPEEHVTEASLPSELSYTSETSENADCHVDQSSSEACKSNKNDLNPDRERYEKGNFIQDVSNIPLRVHTATLDVYDSIFRIHGKQKEKHQKETFPEPKSYTPSNDNGISNIVETQNMQQNKGFVAELQTLSHFENINPSKDKDLNMESSESGPSMKYSSKDDKQSSSTWEVQIEKLQEELDRLYKEQMSGRNGLPEVKKETELPVKPEGSNVKLQHEVQPKCPPKCPSISSNGECLVKCWESVSMKNVGRIDSSPIPLSEKQSIGPDFEEYTNGYSYFRRLQTQEYDRTMPALDEVPLPPKKKSKPGRTKVQFYNEKHDGDSYRKQETHLERYLPQEEPLNEGRKRKSQNNYELNPPHEKTKKR